MQSKTLGLIKEA